MSLLRLDPLGECLQIFATAFRLLAIGSRLADSANVVLVLLPKLKCRYPRASVVKMLFNLQRRGGSFELCNMRDVVASVVKLKVNSLSASVVTTTLQHSNTTVQLFAHYLGLVELPLVVGAQA